MKTLKVDRIDTQYVFCTDKDAKMYALDPKEVPNGVKSKDILVIDDNGTITLQRAWQTQVYYLYLA